MIRFSVPARPGVARHPRLGVAAAGVAVTGMLVAAGGCNPAAHPAAGPATPNPPFGWTADCDSVTTCYTPRQLQVAYGIKPLLDHGINGHGETVVLPELGYQRPSPPEVSDLRQDLARFDQLFGLPAAPLSVVTSLAPAASPWLANGEEVLDAAMAHAVAPGAAITVVLLKPTALDNPPNAVAAAVAAIRLGLSQGSVISISAAGQAGGEHCDTRAEVGQLNSALQAAAVHHVTVVAASGDVGAAGEPCHVIEGLTGGSFPPVTEVSLPASDPLVLAVGGTSLTASHKTGAYTGETAWCLPYGTPGTQFQGSGGGFSRLFTRPGYQDGVAGIGAWRGARPVRAANGPLQELHLRDRGGRRRRDM